MPKIVDARGLTCPQPVILVKKEMEKFGSDSLTIIVDNEGACENITRMAKHMGWEVSVEDKKGEYFLLISKKGFTEEISQGGLTRAFCEEPAKARVLMVSSLFLGQGDDELGEVLMRGFFYALAEAETVPEKLVLLNSGVKLACEGSPVLEQLETLERRGVEIFACGTCLDFYGLKKKIKIGGITNMYEIVFLLTAGGAVML